MVVSARPTRAGYSRTVSGKHYSLQRGFARHASRCPTSDVSVAQQRVVAHRIRLLVIFRTMPSSLRQLWAAARLPQLTHTVIHRLWGYPHCDQRRSDGARQIAVPGAAATCFAAPFANVLCTSGSIGDLPTNCRQALPALACSQQAPARPQFHPQLSGISGLTPHRADFSQSAVALYPRGLQAVILTSSTAPSTDFVHKPKPLVDF